MKTAIALVGAPNSGKTTLYNWLTHSSFKTVNYPGSTVEYSLGILKVNAKSEILVMDTPGTYSVEGVSDDEKVTHQALYNHPEFKKPKLVVVVLDGSQLARHLILAKQISETGFPFVIAITMKDLLEKNKSKIDISIIEKEFGVPVFLIDGILGGGVPQLSDKIQEILNQEQQFIPKVSKWNESELVNKINDAEVLANKAFHSVSQNSIYDRTALWDRYLLHPFWGVILFVLIMTGLFASIYWVAAPLMDGVDSSFSIANEAIKNTLGNSLVVDFLADGVITGFGAILVFVPQIFILFFGIGILESTGYLARAATLIDRPFAFLGISGRSFVPLLSGYACAVPAMLATRNLSSSRERWIANFVIPLMQCSARLPVFALLLGFLFIGEPAWKPGLALAFIYFMSIIIGAIAAGIVNSILPKNHKTFFMMELPMYRQPKFKVLLKQCLTKTQSYLKKAGPAILVFSMLIWVGTTFPRNGVESTELSQSYLGKAGLALEPVFEPMGVDWRVGVGLLTAFAAREVFVSSISVVFQAGEEETEGLVEKLTTATFPDGRKIFTTASCVALIIFFMIALQCMSTVAVSMRETGSIKFAMSQLVVFNLIAYGLAVLAYQLLN